MPSSIGTESQLWVTVLAGGIGARFWPASTLSRPKPLLSFGSEQPLIRDAVERAQALVDVEHLLILAGAHLIHPFRAVLPELPKDSFWSEPAARGTGPALTWAAHRLHESDPQAVLISLHADHHIAPETAFPPILRRAVDIAIREDVLLSIAVEPTRPETGYGYILPGEPFAETDLLEAFRIAEFVEKPTETTANGYIAHGYLWNTGIFVLPVARFLDEVRRHAPEIARSLPYLDRGDEEGFFDQAHAISVDQAVFERSDQVGAVRADFRWDDVGGWEALSRILPSDSAGNCVVGEAHTIASGESIVWAEDGPVVLFGVEGLVVVRTGDVTLVASRERAHELKQLLAELPGSLQGTPRRGAGEADP